MSNDKAEARTDTPEVTNDEAEASTKPDVGPPGPELVIGVVTPVGAKTTEFVSNIRGALATWNYKASVIRLSNRLPSVPPDGEHEHDRIRRLIKAGNAWAVEHEPIYGKTGLAPLAIQHVQQVRKTLQRAAGLGGERGGPRPIPRRAYIIQSLKRPEEVTCLRKVYRSAFILFAHQPSAKQQEEFLMSQLATHVSTNRDELLSRARALIELDADEILEHGQKVRETYALADVFVGEDADPSRGIRLLFSDRTVAPTPGEYAMYVADATAARSLTLSRRVGAVLMRKGSILATGMNETPEIAGETPDVIAGFDASEQSKQALAVKTIEHLVGKNVLRDQPEDQEGRCHKPESTYREWKQLLETEARDQEKIIEARAKFEDEATRLLDDSDLSDLTEFQRAVHAEMWAVMDAARRGIALKGAVVYTNTYPCHLCWKHLFTLGVKKLYYIKPYRKSRASEMYGSSAKQLIEQFYGIAPRIYRQFFEREIVSRKAQRRDDIPLSGQVRVEPPDRDRAVPNGLYAGDDSYLKREHEFREPSPDGSVQRRSTEKDLT